MAMQYRLLYAQRTPHPLHLQVICDAVSEPFQVAARYDGPIIVQKGPHDAMSDGKQTVVCKVDGSPRRAGGQVCACCSGFDLSSLIQ